MAQWRSTAHKTQQHKTRQHKSRAPLVLDDHFPQPQVGQSAAKVVGVADLGDLQLQRRRALGLEPLLCADVGAGRRRRLVLDGVEELV